MSTSTENKENPKTSSSRNAQNSTGNAAGTGKSERVLFMFVLLLSIGYGIFVNWNKTLATETLEKKLQAELKEVRHELELYQKDQRMLGEMVSFNDGNIREYFCCD